ncbi:MAG: glycerol-3-phosphate acyltransferase [Dehalococcoidia bacterium]|nr:glycerol-3-phosphate acyltransferase [Dehalococcoidia bacterium]
MEIAYSTLLAVSAFCLGACPFSLWIGHWLLGKDVRAYGDANPGAANLFRAGGRKAFCLALLLDIAKGVPFVFLAHSYFGLPEAAVMAVGLSAILGCAFSPILRLKGGKSLAVTGGVLLALPQHEVLIAVLVFMFLAFLFIQTDAWMVILGSAGSLIYLAVTKGSSWEPLFMLCVVAILAAKHYKDLQTMPRFKVRLVAWLRTRKRPS